MRRLAALVMVLAALPATVAGQTPPSFPRHIPSSGGEVVIPSARHQREYDEVGYAPARRAGDTLYVSGAIVFRAPGEGHDREALEQQVRRTFTQLGRTLEASGVTFEDVALLNSFHVWDGPDFTGARSEQTAAIAKVWREFSTGPRPAWTAVGTTGLLAETGIIEIQLTVHAPRASAER
ncbi:RutC family protein YjgH [compost metagenome]